MLRALRRGLLSRTRTCRSVGADVGEGKHISFTQSCIGDVRSPAASCHKRTALTNTKRNTPTEGSTTRTRLHGWEKEPGGDSTAHGGVLLRINRGRLSFESIEVVDGALPVFGRHDITLVGHVGNVPNYRLRVQVLPSAQKNRHGTRRQRFTPPPTSEPTDPGKRACTFDLCDTNFLHVTLIAPICFGMHAQEPTTPVPIPVDNPRYPRARPAYWYGGSGAPRPGPHTSMRAWVPPGTPRIQVCEVGQTQGPARVPAHPARQRSRVPRERQSALFTAPAPTQPT